MNINLETLKEHQDALKEKFGATAQLGWANVSQTQLSIASYSGGATVNNQFYAYNPTDDSLIRADVIKWLSKLIKSQKAKAKA